MELWPLLALIFSFFGAAIIHTNQVFKVEGTTLVFLRGLFLMLVGLPFIMVMGAPTDPTFYGLAALTAIGISTGDHFLFNAAAKHGSHLSALYIPLKIFTVFILWSIVDPASLTPLIDEIWRLIVVLGLFGAIAFALLSMQKCKTSWAGITAVMPVAVLFTFSDVFAKEGLNGAQTIVDPIIFYVVTSMVSGLFAGSALVVKKKMNKDVFALNNLKGGAVISLVMVIGIPIMLWAFALAPNPAYVGAITVLSGVWLSLYHKLVNGGDLNLKSAFTLIGSAIILLLVLPNS